MVAADVGGHTPTYSFVVMDRLDGAVLFYPSLGAPNKKETP